MENDSEESSFMGWPVVRKVKIRSGPKEKWQIRKKMHPFSSKAKTRAFAKNGSRFRRKFLQGESLPSQPFLRHTRLTDLLHEKLSKSLNQGRRLKRSFVEEALSCIQNKEELQTLLKL